MKKRYITLLVLLAVAVIGGGVWAWGRFFGTTRIAFVNYQVMQLGLIARANDNPMISISELAAADIPEHVDDYDMVFVNGMGLRLTAEQHDALEVAALCGLPVLTTSSTNPANYIVSLDEADADTLVDYIGVANRSNYRSNYRSMLNYVRTYIDRKVIFCGEVSPVQEGKSGLLSHADFAGGDAEDVVFASVKDYRDYVFANRPALKQARHSVIVTGMMGDPTDIVNALEERGILTYYASSLRDLINGHYADSINADAVINMAHGRLGDWAVEYLAERNIPLFCPLNVNRLDSEWLADKQGMNGGFMSQSIVTPEIDGALRPFSLFAQRVNSEGLREAYTMPDRLADFVETVENYISLKDKANSERKVAIYFFKGPGQSALTASGLEVAPSLYNLLVRLRNEGYNVSGMPNSAAELEALIMKQGAVFNTYAEGAFDDFMKNGNPELISKEQYDEWTAKSLSADMRADVEKEFGPFPGSYMVSDDGRLAVARLQFGNVVLMPQNMAGKGDNAFAITHGTGAAPSHTFIASYLWMQYGFGADVLVHFGTHGGLEYTPYKQVALSSEDWSDRMVGNIPHLYVYTIGNVGEALIAKRRTYAGIQSHLTAPFLESGLRSQYKELDDAVAAYNKTPNDANSLHVKQLAIKLGVASELQLDTADLATPFSEAEVAKIESFAEEIASEKIVGELYTLGRPYSDERIESSVVAMTTDPIAYCHLALDKKLGRAVSDAEKHKSLFSQKYLLPAKNLAVLLLKNPDMATDQLVCKVAGISANQMARAREVDNALSGPKDMMSMMMQMGAKMQAEAAKSDSTTQAAKPDSAKLAQMKQMGKDMDPKKALQMAKIMGAPPAALKKMAEAMGVSGSKPKGDGLSKMMQAMAQSRPDFSDDDKEMSRLIMELERAILNVGRYRNLLKRCPEMEMSSLINAMQGGYTRPTPGGDVISNPNAIPTGRNMFGINAEATPSEQAWEKGRQLAQNTIDAYKANHHDSIPRKVSYTLWSGEFIETEGATLAQVLYMLGVEPIRDAFGRVTDLRLIPSAELGRPRIDVVVQTSGQLRDLAASRLFLISRAVSMAAAASDDEFPNEVAEGVRESERVLTAKGLSPKEARQMATRRVFGGMNGSYGTGITGMVQAGDRWDKTEEIAQVYLNNMSGFYGSEDEWEQDNKDAFEAALTRTDAVIQPRQSNTWGALSLDHVYEFMGGMNLAVRNVTGKEPDAYLADYRNRNNARLQGVKEAIGVESRSTLLNPVYIKEKMKGGSTSASSFAELVENTYGWNVMKPDVIDNRLWDDIYGVYVKDNLNLGTRAFFEDKSPAALQQMTAVMLESARKGMWKATPNQLAATAQLHTELVRDHGAACTSQVCDNAKLRDFIRQNAKPDVAADYDKAISHVRDANIANAKDGMVMKKETLSNEADASTFDSTLAVVIVSLIGIVGLLVLVSRRRKKQSGR